MRFVKSPIGQPLDYDCEEERLPPDLDLDRERPLDEPLRDDCRPPDEFRALVDDRLRPLDDERLRPLDDERLRLRLDWPERPRPLDDDRLLPRLEREDPVPVRCCGA